MAQAARIFALIRRLNQLTPCEPVNRPSQVVMLQGGLRGAVTLALSMPTTLDDWWNVRSIAFSVVLFTLFVQARSTPLLLRH